MATVYQVVQIPLLVAVICWGSVQTLAQRNESSATLQATAEKPAGNEAIILASEPIAIASQDMAVRNLPRVTLLTPARKHHEQEKPATHSEPFGRQVTTAPPSDVVKKWTDLQSRIDSEVETLAACRSGNGACPESARRFLDIIKLGQQRQGRARLGEINRAVNLSIRPVSDWSQYGVADFWSAPLATLGTGAGDCEDYAIVKYVALRESGITPDDLRLVIVHDFKQSTDHAVVAVRHEEQWLLLDNRTLIMANADDARHYYPLFVLGSVPN